MENNSSRRTISWPVYVAVVLLAVVVVIFVITFISASKSELAGPIAQILTADLYLDKVTQLLKIGIPENGNKLIDQYECGACHRLNANQIAPSFKNIAERASQRRPPLTTAAYIYESITNPSAFLAEDYPNAMPANYASRLSEQELADILAYLVTQDAK